MSQHNAHCPSLHWQNRADTYVFHEIERLKAEAEANAQNDQKERERIDKLNKADSMIFQTENQLKELDAQLPAEHKEKINAALEQLRTAHKAQDIAGIDTAINALNAAWQAASQQVYQQQAQTGQQTQQGGPQSGGSKQDNAEDTDFEEV